MCVYIYREREDNNKYKYYKHLFINVFESVDKTCLLKLHRLTIITKKIKTFLFPTMTGQDNLMNFNNKNPKVTKILF